MPTDPEPLDDGLYSVTNDFGQELVVDGETGIVIGGVDADGDELDTSGLVLDLTSPSGVAERDEEYVDDGYDERAAELDERLARLEEHLARPQVLIPGDPVTYDEERIADALAAQGELMEAGLGRALTLAERRAIATEALEHVRLGEPLDLQAAADTLAWRGEQGIKHDLDDDHDRVAYMTERIQDGERRAAAEQRGDDLSSERPPPDQTEFDLDDDRQRQQYMAQRLQGDEAYQWSPTAEDDEL
jgi:hypothetical protein